MGAYVNLMETTEASEGQSPPSSIFPLKPCNPSHHYSKHITEPRVSLLILLTSKTLLLLWSLATLCPFQIALTRSTVSECLRLFWEREKKWKSQRKREKESVEVRQSLERRKEGQYCGGSTLGTFLRLKDGKPPSDSGRGKLLELLYTHPNLQEKNNFKNKPGSVSNVLFYSIMLLVLTQEKLETFIIQNAKDF